MNTTRRLGSKARELSFEFLLWVFYEEKFDELLIELIQGQGNSIQRKILTWNKEDDVGLSDGYISQVFTEVTKLLNEELDALIQGLVNR